MTEAVPFKEKVASRMLIEHADLYEKRMNQLNDPYMQTAMWAIMEVRDARERAIKTRAAIDDVYQNDCEN